MHPTDTSGGDTARRGRHELRVDRLRALLDDREITQTELARRMGMDRGHINDYFHGRARLGRPFMDALRNVFPNDYSQLVVWNVTSDDDDQKVGDTE